jgi:DNA-binding transcriptional ArsR family regulator
MQRDVFQALADPTRRAIIAMLMNAPMTPNAIAGKFDASRQAVSKHLQVLDACGLLDSKRLGRERYFALRPRALKEVSDWVEPFRSLWEARYTRLDRVLAELTSKGK